MPLLQKWLQQPSWQQAMSPFWNEAAMQHLFSFLEEESARSKKIYPPLEKRFAAFDATPYDALRVVIIGQDPYHGEGQAHGLSFSVPQGVQLPPSLRNIYKELHQDLGIEIARHGFLMPWASQGVLLLNTVLSVEEGKPASHAKIGWEYFTDQVLCTCFASPHPLIFVLWGRHAQDKVKRLIPTATRTTHHHVIESAHPSPLSAHNGFFGSRPFSRINALLAQEGFPPIDWRLQE